MGEYTVQASIVVRLPAADVLGWLTTPDLMTRWMVGADTIEPLDALGAAPGAMTRVIIFAARYRRAFTGQITELSPARLVRRYLLADEHPNRHSIAAGLPEYERCVTWDLVPTPAGTGVTCAARTVIPGLPRSIKDGDRASTKSLQRSLEHLAACAEGRPGSHFGDTSKNTGEPL